MSNRKTLEVIKPWGNFRQYTHNEISTVKILTVAAGAKLSLQSHHKREELWIILDEGVSVQIDDQIIIPQKGAEVFINQGTKHRLIGASTETCRVLEISFGEFDENDIVRYQDDYRRI